MGHRGVEEVFLKLNSSRQVSKHIYGSPLLAEIEKERFDIRARVWPSRIRPLSHRLPAQSQVKVRPYPK